MFPDTVPPAGRWPRARPWRPAPVLAILRSEVDLAWPNRSTASDGFIGDQSHQSRKSDHNPDADGYVRAWDVTADAHNGPDPSLLASFLRDVGASGSQRFALGGYVIWNHRIVSELSEWQWIAYKGDDPHVTHLHISCSRLPVFYKISRPWHVQEALQERGRRRPV